MPKEIIKIACEYCSKEFTSKKHTAKYCSNACRTKAYRKRNGLPFPDFSQLITSKLPSQNERKLILFYDELNNYMLEEKALDKSYKDSLQKYEKSLKFFENNPSTWSRDYSARRQIEVSELKSNLLKKQKDRIDTEKKIAELQKGIERDRLVKKGFIISADDLAGLKFTRLVFDGVWSDLFDSPHHNFIMIVYGKPNSGKTTFSMQFANYLKKFDSVVYIAIDEKFGASIQQKLLKNDIKGIDISWAKTRQEIEFVIRKGSYKFVFIDSMSQAFLSFADIDEFRRKFRDCAFILIIEIKLEIDDNTRQKFKSSSDILVEIESGNANVKGIISDLKEYKIF
jgi:hypothetical protein